MRRMILLLGSAALAASQAFVIPEAHSASHLGWRAATLIGHSQGAIVRQEDAAATPAQLVHHADGTVSLEFAAGAAAALGSPGDALLLGEGARNAADCAFTPGLIIQDDGSVDTGWGFGIAAVDSRFVDRFTPSAYPATIGIVCFALAGNAGAPTSLIGDIIVYDDDGAGGAPGTLLGTQPFSINGVPQPLAVTPTWFAVDLSGLALSVGSGSVYIGVRWQPSDPNIFMVGDITANGRPVGFAGGYRSGDGGVSWVQNQTGTGSFLNYRSLFIRASFDNGAPPLGFPQPYCQVFYTAANIEPISLVQFAGIDNATSPATGAGAIAHENYTHLVAQVEAGDIYDITVEGNTGGNFTNQFRAFFDWNQDGQFDFATESVYIGQIVNSTGADGIQATAPITIPASVAPGLYRMRVLKRFGAALNSADNPCAVAGFGQAEDYTVEVLGGGGPTDPAIATAPASFSFSVTTGLSGSDELTIANVGGGTLVWDIETDSLPTGQRAHDPALDEVLTIPNFSISSPPNGGTPQVFTVPGGVLTSGRVVGFSFEGTVQGVTGSSSWASDMCMRIQGPDGSSYDVGGFSGTIAGCNLNPWDFQGSGSDTDGTYSSEHDDVWPFPVGAEDDGDWTITFINGWDSASAATMNWSGVTVTLHKFTPAEACDDPNALGWLSVNPAAGSTVAGAPSSVDVLFDADGVAPGTYEAFLCVNSNDSVGNDLVVVPVEMTVVAPEITVAPASITAAADPGNSTTATLTIGNLGAGDLLWEIDEAPAASSPRAHFPAYPRQVRSSGRSGSPFAEPVDLAWLDKLEQSQAGRQQAHSRSAARGTSFEVPAYTTTGFSRSDYVTFDALVPGALSSIVDPGPGTIFAQTFIDDDFSQHFFIATGGGALPQNAYGFVNTATGAVTQLGVLTGVPGAGTWTSAAWDRTTGTVYATLVPGGGDNRLYAINVGAGTGTLVGSISGIAGGGIIIAIAISPDGLMYAIEIIDDVLVAIDKTSGAGSVIGATGVNANFAQDMDFDASTGTLYWAGYLGGGNSQLFTLNLATGAATAIGAVQDGAELLSFSIAVSGGNCSDPADVPWLSVDADSGAIPSGGPDDEVEVLLDATSLSDGVYNASLCVLSNDPARPLVEVPVEFVVGEGLGTQADLGIGLFGVPGTVNAGGNVSFVVTVANFGPSVATDVVVELDLPSEFAFVSGHLVEGSGNWACSAAGQLVTCELTAGDLPVNSFAAVLQINASVDAGAASGVVQTDALVSSSNFADPNPGNNTASVSTTIIGAPADGIFANGFECAPGYPDCPTGGKPGFYTDRAEFLANVQEGYYEEDFATVPGGPAGPSLNFSGNGFSYVVSAVGGGSNNLYNDPGIISTDSASDSLRITFTGAPVTAIGGNFWATDINFVPTGGEIILTLEDGTVESYSPSAPSSFGGFITESPIVHITIEAPNVPTNNWPVMDNVIAGEL